MRVLGTLTREQADLEAKRSGIYSSGAEELWLEMTDDERDELGIQFLKLSADPVFKAKQEGLVDGLKKIDPDLWRNAEAAIQRQLKSYQADG